MSISKALSYRTIAFNTIYFELGLDIHECLFLSQFVFWSEKMNDVWFYKTMKDWEQETRLTRRHQTKARKKLKELNILEEKSQGNPKKLYFKLNREVLDNLLLSITAEDMSKKEGLQTELECTKRTFKSVQNVHSRVYETYTQECADRTLSLYTKDDIQKKTTKDICNNKVADSEILIFEHWKSVCEHPRAKLDTKRRQKIRDRLKEGYTVDDLIQAINGCKKSPFHQGHNSDGKIYDDLELILRSASKVDNFIALDEKPQLPKAAGVLKSEKEAYAWSTASNTAKNEHRESSLRLVEPRSISEYM